MRVIPRSLLKRDTCLSVQPSSTAPTANRLWASAARSYPPRLVGALLLSAATALVIACAAAQAGSPPEGIRVAIVVIDRMTFRDLEALARRFDSFRELTNTGALGLMNVASADGLSRSGTYSTLAAGAKASGVLDAWTWYRSFPSPGVAVYDFGSVSGSIRTDLQYGGDATFFSTPVSILADLLRQLRSGALELVVFVSPTSDEVWAPSPIVLCGKGFAKGVLTSGTTHTAGLVADVDFAPTILHALNAPIPDSMIGLPMAAAATRGSIQLVGKLDLGIRSSHRCYPAVPIAAGSLIPLGVVLGACALVVSRGRVAFARASRSVAGAGWWLVLSILFVPCGVMQHPVLTLSVVLSLLVVVFIVAAHRARGATGLLVMLPLFGIPLIAVADCLLGSPLIRSSLFSHYSLIHGLRYYGIGNQTAGIVLGSLIGGIAVWAWIRRVEQPSKRAIWFFCLWAFAVAIVFGFPGMGSNMGMYIAAYATGMALLAALRGQGLGWARGAILIIVGALILCSFGAIDAVRDPSVQTHLGRAVVQAAETGGGSLWAAAARKVAQNFEILGQPIILSLIIVAVVFAVLWRLIQPWGAGRRRGLAMGRVALWSAAVAFLANDSGVIAASFLIGGYVVGAVEVSMARLIEEARG
jgi:hypothetical protein